MLRWYDAFRSTDGITALHADTLMHIPEWLESEDERVRQFLREGRRGWTEGLVADYRAIMAGHEVADADLEMAAELVQSMTFGTIVHFLELTPEEQKRERSRLVDGLVRFSLGGLSALFGVEPTERHAPAREESS